MKIKIPKSEQVWATYNNVNGETVYVMTSKASRDFYFLYKLNSDGSLVKLGKARTPPELEKKFDVESGMRA